MRKKKLVASAAAIAVAGALVVAPGGAGAVTFRHMLGYSGGTAIKAVGATVESGLTAESSVDTVTPGPKQSNTAVHVGVNGVATVDAVHTSATSVALPDGGVQVVTVGKTAGISLLGGAIRADAVTTTDVATVHGNNTTSYSVNTQFVGLKIAGITLPVNIPKNYQITIPNVATIVLNAGFASTGAPGSGTIMTEGAGLYLSLLNGRGDSPLGTVVFLNPTYSAIATFTPAGGPVIGGYAYGSKATTSAGNLINISAGPTAQIAMPANGTNGVVQRNTTATVTIPSLLVASAITDYAQGVRSTTIATKSYSTMTTHLLNVNLLGGLIKADALTGVAHVETTPAGGTVASAKTSFVNLTIAGHKIPISISPNTVIKLGNIGKVTIREQVTSASQALVTLLDIRISTASYGLPAGAHVQVGVAAAWVLVS